MNIGVGFQVSKGFSKAMLVIVSSVKYWILRPKSKGLYWVIFSFDEILESHDILVNRFLQVFNFLSGILVEAFSYEVWIGYLTHTPCAILALSMLCFSLSLWERTFSRLGSNLIAKYQSDRMYGVRTPSILRINSVLHVSRVLGPIRARDPAQLVYQRLTSATKRWEKCYTIFLCNIAEVQMLSTSCDTAN